MSSIVQHPRNVSYHDGHGLNDLIRIDADAQDPNAGGASHEYVVYFEGWPDHLVGHIKFQHGPRDVEGSTPGMTDQTLIQIILDRYKGFQSGPYACRENALVLTKLEEALHWMEHRVKDRAKRGVLGRNEK